VLRNGQVPKDFFIARDQVRKWEYLKGAKSEKRKNHASGLVYHYSEGPMAFPDPLDRPARTIITAEGGSSPSRFKHVIKHPGNGRLRRLTPLELERLNMFPDGHTAGASDEKRAFFMGNALVTGIVERIGSQLLKAMAARARMAASRVPRPRK
jgi:DNA (cytosine-5)-methyltransferase 1